MTHPLPSSTPGPPHPEAYAGGRPALSGQAIRLHVRALETAIRTGTGDLLGRTTADLLAEQCGALPDELVEAGYWRASDLGYTIGWSPRPITGSGVVRRPEGGTDVRAAS